MRSKRLSRSNRFRILPNGLNALNGAQRLNGLNHERPKQEVTKRRSWAQRSSARRLATQSTTSGVVEETRQSEEPKTGCQREPTAPLALSSSERRDPAHFARLRPLRRPSRPKQHRDFHQTERRLTSHRSGDIAQARKKGGLKFLYRDPKALAHSPPVKHNRACRPSVTGRGRSSLSPIS